MNLKLTEAFAATESITRTQARNFYYGIRLLPRQKRTALCAVYALARRILLTISAISAKGPKWSWRESNPRPRAPNQVFSGCSS